MTDYNVSITISAADQASDELRNVSVRVREISDNTSNVAREAVPAGNSLKTMADNFNLAFNAAIVQRAINLTAQLYNIGVEARNTSNVFEALVNSAGLSDETLARLQERSHGVVDETTLMAGANRLLMMGLVDNEDELVNTVGLITDLSLVTGRDLNTAFQDFGALLANQSVLRLDNFGLSSERVRARIEELQATSADLSDTDAFNMAVFEEGARVLETVAPAIEANTRRVDQAGAELRNFGQDIGTNLVENVDRIINDLESLTSGTMSVGTAAATIVDASEAEAAAAALGQIDPNVVEQLNSLGDGGGALAFFQQLKETTDTYTEFFGQAPTTMEVLQATMNDFDLTPAEEAAAHFWLDYVTGSDEAVIAVRENIDLSAHHISEVMDGVSSDIEALSAEVHPIRFRVEVDDPNGVFSGSGGGMGMAAAVRNNGGSVPGTDARVSVNGR